MSSTDITALHVFTHVNRTTTLRNCNSHNPNFTDEKIDDKANK